MLVPLVYFRNRYTLHVFAAVVSRFRHVLIILFHPSMQIIFYSIYELLLIDVHSASHVSSPSTTLRRSPSVLSGKSDADSASTVIASVTRGSNLSPLQLLEVGKY